MSPTPANTDATAALVARLIHLDEIAPGLLDEVVGDCWHHLHEAGPEVDHETPGQAFYVGELSRKLAPLFRLTVGEMERIVSGCVLNERREIIADVVAWYEDKIHVQQPREKAITQPRQAPPKREPLPVVILPPGESHRVGV